METVTVENALIVVLKSFNYPVFRQGSLAEDEPYPPTFVTWWNRSEEGVSFYDNKTTRVSYVYDVNVYSTDVETSYSLLREIRAALKASGWVMQDRGHDIASDEITHTGRGMTILYNENEEE